MKVLICDDDPVSRRLLQMYMQKWGHDVVVAEDGGEAWRLFEADEFPIVISDWMMPELDGVELIRRIRARPRPGYVYTILLTAKAQKEDLVEGMEAGADDFITKPFDRDELRVRLREGERIVRLEQTLAAQTRDLRQAQAALEQNQFLTAAGALAADLVPEIERALADAADGIEALGCESSSALEKPLENLSRARKMVQTLSDSIRRDEA